MTAKHGTTITEQRRPGRWCTCPLTQEEFRPTDHAAAQRIAETLGYTQMAYTTSSSLWGLFCLPEDPHRLAPWSRQRHLPPYAPGCIIKTQELGLLFVLTRDWEED